MVKTKQLVLVTLLLVTSSWGKFSLNTYEEDLAVHRVQYKVVEEKRTPPSGQRKSKKPVSVIPTHDITERLYTLLQHKKTAKEQIKTISGYTIQVYSGGGRDLAFKMKHKLYARFPAVVPEVHYNLPNYTVRVGKFLDKIEAYAMYAAIKKHIPQAIIRPIQFVNKPHIFTTRQSVLLKATDMIQPGPEPNKHAQEE